MHFLKRLWDILWAIQKERTGTMESISSNLGVQGHSMCIPAQVHSDTHPPGHHWVLGLCVRTVIRSSAFEWDA